MRATPKKIIIACFAVCGFFLGTNWAVACSCAESVTVGKEFIRAKNVVVLKAISILGKDAPTKPDDRVAGFNFVVQRVFKGRMKQGEKLQMIAAGPCGGARIRTGNSS